MRFLPVAVVLASLAGALTHAAGPAERWWAHVRFLADDALEGRDTGSPGHRTAAEYVAQGYRAAGLEPGGTGGYFQPIAFESRQFVEEQSRLTIVRGGKEEPIVFGDAAIVSMRVRPARHIDAQLAFAGYGLSVPEAGYDDLQGVDLTGRIAVVVSGGPVTLSGPLLAHASSVRSAALHRAGAIGLVTILRTSDIPWERTKLRRLTPVKGLVEDPLGETTQQLALTVNPDAAEGWFSGSGHTAAEILALAAERKPLPRFALSGQLRATLVTSVTPLRSDNVIGILRGTDRQLAGEHVVLSAHLDHIGRGEPVNGDAIYNGAMDNASGTATLLEVARRLRESGVRLRRSLVFLSVTGGGARAARLPLLHRASHRAGLVHRGRPQHGHVPAPLSDAVADRERARGVGPRRRSPARRPGDRDRRRRRSRAGTERIRPERPGTASSVAESPPSLSRSAGRSGRRSTRSSSGGETSAITRRPTTSTSRWISRRPTTSRASTQPWSRRLPTATSARAGTTPAFSSVTPLNERSG